MLKGSPLSRATARSARRSRTSRSSTPASRCRSSRSPTGTTERGVTVRRETTDPPPRAMDRNRTRRTGTRRAGRRKSHRTTNPEQPADAIPCRQRVDEDGAAGEHRRPRQPPAGSRVETSTTGRALRRSPNRWTNLRVGERYMRFEARERRVLAVVKHGRLLDRLHRPTPCAETVAHGPASARQLRRLQPMRSRIWSPPAADCSAKESSQAWKSSEPERSAMRRGMAGNE